MRNLLLFIFTVASFSIWAQTVSVSSSEVLLTGDPSDTDLHAYIMVKNEGTEEISLLWKRNIINMPEEWISWICDLNNCYVDFVGECPSNKPNVLAPGQEFELQIHANPRNVAGSANIVMDLFTGSDPSNILNSITLDIQAGVSTSTKEVSKDGIKVYPNPTVDFFQINYDNVSKVAVYNIVGSKMVEFDAYPDKSYDVTNLKSGIYLVRMTDDQNRVIKTVRLSKR